MTLVINVCETAVTTKLKTVVIWVGNGFWNHHKQFIMSDRKWIFKSPKNAYYYNSGVLQETHIIMAL